MLMKNQPNLPVSFFKVSGYQTEQILGVTIGVKLMQNLGTPLGEGGGGGGGREWARAYLL